MYHGHITWVKKGAQTVTLTFLYIHLGWVGFTHESLRRIFVFLWLPAVQYTSIDTDTRTPASQLNKSFLGMYTGTVAPKVSSNWMKVTYSSFFFPVTWPPFTQILTHIKTWIKVHRTGFSSQLSVNHVVLKTWSRCFLKTGYYTKWVRQKTRLCLVWQKIKPQYVFKTLGLCTD